VRDAHARQYIYFFNTTNHTAIFIFQTDARNSEANLPCPGVRPAFYVVRYPGDLIHRSLFTIKYLYVMGKNYQEMKRYEQAEAAFVHATQLVSGRLYPWYLLTKLYDEMGMKDKVDETTAIVLTKEPKVQSPAINEMREEVKRLKTKN
jgi:hypothetical protein